MGKQVIDNHAGAIALPRHKLIRGYLEIGEYLQDLLWIGAELGKEILRLGIPIYASKPVIRGNGDDTWNRPNFLPIKRRHGLGERDPVAGYQALR